MSSGGRRAHPGVPQKPVPGRLDQRVPKLEHAACPHRIARSSRCAGSGQSDVRPTEPGTQVFPALPNSPDPPPLYGLVTGNQGNSPCQSAFFQLAAFLQPYGNSHLGSRIDHSVVRQILKIPPRIIVKLLSHSITIRRSHPRMQALRHGAAGTPRMHAWHCVFVPANRLHQPPLNPIGSPSR